MAIQAVQTSILFFMVLDDILDTFSFGVYAVVQL